MKIRFTLLCLLVSMACFSQNFEGVIKWSVKTDITDPKLKAQMDEAQKKMSDPATQAQLKQMQEKMNDPQMKAMMDANPQMKTQMENALKMMQGGDMNSMMPKGLTIKVKNGNTLSSMEGGMMAGNETLYRKDKNQTYMINATNKTYAVLPSGSSHSTSQADVKFTKTTETQKILNYTCTKTIVTVNDNGKSIDQIFWSTTEIKDLDFKSLAHQRMSSNQAMFYEGIEGVPLKMEITTPQVKMVMEVTELKKSSLASSVFEIPVGYSETKLPGY